MESAITWFNLLIKIDAAIIMFDRLRWNQVTCLFSVGTRRQIFRHWLKLYYCVIHGSVNAVRLHNERTVRHIFFPLFLPSILFFYCRYKNTTGMENL